MRFLNHLPKGVLLFPGAACLLALAAVACDIQGEAGAIVESQSSRLETVKDRGNIHCATQSDLPGFGFIDSAGNERGFDVDLCRAVAAAIFGDPGAVEFQHVSYAERGPLLQAAEIDILARTTTWTTTREIQWGDFTIIMFYDGQGFLVPRSMGVSSALELDGSAVCVAEGTTTKLNLEDYFRQNGMGLELLSYEQTSETYLAYEQGLCDATTIDKSQLAAIRSGFANPEDHIILPETISKEPLSPMVPRGDHSWTALVSIVFYTLINAEELGVTQGNVEGMRNSDNIQVRRLLGTEGAFGQVELGLKPDFAVDVITAVGNYGEIYDRYMGPEGESFTLPRGQNNLWTNGGLIYAPPIR
ncbi:MAG: amino acid ABC transporter substrate-binding protein [Chloroflexota bacterium]|nr:amino acid ABC transporter substrate-binding protein [Chloroflexota bacterium]